MDLEKASHYRWIPGVRRMRYDLAGLVTLIEVQLVIKIASLFSPSSLEMILFSRYHFIHVCMHIKAFCVCIYRAGHLERAVKSSIEWVHHMLGRKKPSLLLTCLQPSCPHLGLDTIFVKVTYMSIRHPIICVGLSHGKFTIHNPPRPATTCTNSPRIRVTIHVELTCDYLFAIDRNLACGWNGCHSHC